MLSLENCTHFPCWTTLKYMAFSLECQCIAKILQIRAICFIIQKVVLVLLQIYMKKSVKEYFIDFYKFKFYSYKQTPGRSISRFYSLSVTMSCLRRDGLATTVGSPLNMKRLNFEDTDCFPLLYKFHQNKTCVPIFLDINVHSSYGFKSIE